MASRQFGGAQSGKTESFLRMPVPASTSHAQVSNDKVRTGLYRIPRDGQDLCPTCGEGTLQPIGATHDDVQFVCRNNDCGQKVVRRKGMNNLEGI